MVISCCIDEDDDDLAYLYINTETIKVFDELDKEVSLIDLAIYGGLCSFGSGICLVIGNTKEEASISEKGVNFDDELMDYFWKQERDPRRNTENKIYNESYDLLFDLDPYGYKTFSVAEIHELIKVSECMVENYQSDHLDAQKLRFFAMKLKEVCLEAIKDNKLIIAIGD